MSSSLKNLCVLWPALEPPDIFEMGFAFEFCRKQSQKLCPSLNAGIFWIDYASGKLSGAILSGIPENSDLLVVTDPLIILHETALDRMQKTLRSSHLIACGPKFNETRFSAQQAHLDYVYCNMSSFLEVAQLHAEKASPAYQGIDVLDPGCVLFSAAVVREFSVQVLLGEIGKYAKNCINQCVGQSSGLVGKASRPLQSEAWETGTGFRLDFLSDKDCGRIGVRGSDNHLAVVPEALIHRFFNIFDAPREDLVALVPKTVSRVLDVGCARGGYGKCLKNIRPDIFLAGVEMNALMAESARSCYDDIFVCDVDSLELPYSVDLINCGELIEHLENPWKMLDVLSSMLNPGGYFVLSVPNANHWALVRDLIQGRFQYIPWGPQCVTHIRWFTENDIVKALEDAGFFIDWIDRVQPPPTPDGNQFIQDLIDKGYGDQEQLLTVEIIIRARKKK